MISFDSDRSKKRKWFAEKQIRVIKDLDVPAKTVNWDGFTIKAWQQGDLDGGSVKAPMGMVVCRSTVDQTDLIVADSWIAGFTSIRPAQTMYQGLTNGKSTTVAVVGLSEEDVELYGFRAILFSPDVVTYPYGTVDEVIGPATEHHASDNPVPGVMPIGEAFWLTLSGLNWIDEDGNDLRDNPSITLESTLNFYSDDNGTLVGRRTCNTEQGGFGQYLVQKGVFFMPVSEGIRKIVHVAALYSETPQGEAICAIDQRLTLGEIRSEFIHSGVLWQDIPAGLKYVVLNSQYSSHSSLGNYAFSTEVDSIPTLLHVVNLTNTNPWTASCGFQDWFDDNPDDENWRLFYTISTGGIVYTVDSSQFIGLLDSLANGDVINPGNGNIDWSLARRMLIQLLPWPNLNHSAPYDSAMFHSHLGNVYSWSREYGTVKFTTTGLFTENILLPPEVDTEGVRPEITYAGNEKYFCVCNNVRERIEGVYYGSPFDTWTEVEWNLEGYELVYVRPVKFMEETLYSPMRLSLLGIARKEGVFYTCHNQDGKWFILAQLPDLEKGDEIWAMSVFGIGNMVNDLQRYPTPPHCLPQMPVGPYELYEMGLP